MSFDGKPSGDIELVTRSPAQTQSARAAIAPVPARYFDLPKRLFDIFLALVLLPILAPVIAIFWILIRMDGGPGLFAHGRIGRGGKAFRCYKLRTMVPDAEQRLRSYLAQNTIAAAAWERDFKLDSDPRVTRIGNLLRKTSLDELPQLWNVLKGEMSFVGPRPVTAPELVLYGGRAGYYKALRPGITGIWQVSGRNTVSYQRRVEMDEEYFHQASLWLDIRIILRTGRAVFGLTGR